MNSVGSISDIGNIGSLLKKYEFCWEYFGYRQYWEPPLSMNTVGSISDIGNIGSLLKKYEYCWE